MIRVFTRHKLLSAVFAISLCITTTNFACNPSAWLSVIGQYLPVAIQIAQAIASLVPIFSPSAAATDQTAVTNIGNEAVKDFQLLQSLYRQYQAKPESGTKAEIENVLSTIVSNLPAELPAAHIKDQVLLDKVTASVNILLSVVDVIIAAMPVKNPVLSARKSQATKKAAALRTPMGVKAEWDHAVCQENSACTVLVH